MNQSELLELVNDEKVIELLDEKNDVELAKFLGRKLYNFTTEDETYVDSYWDTIFNNEWIYVSDNMIKHQFQSTAIDIYNLLESDFELNSEYKHDKESQESKSYLDACLDSCKNNKYLITKDTYKYLLKSFKNPSTKQIYKSFIGIEKICAITNQIYNHKALEQQKKLEELKNANFWVNVCSTNQLTFKAFEELNKGIYMGKYETPAEEFKYDLKIGKTTNIKLRKSNYNTGTNPNNEWTTPFKYEVFLGLESAVEKSIHDLLEGLQVSKSKKTSGSGSREIFMSHKKWLNPFISGICTQFNKWAEQVNSYLSFIEEKGRDFDEVEKHIDGFLQEEQIANESMSNKYYIPINHIYEKFGMDYTIYIRQKVVQRYLKNSEYCFTEAKSLDDENGHWYYMKIGKEMIPYFSYHGYLMLCTILKSSGANKVVFDALNGIKEEQRNYYISLQDAYKRINCPFGLFTKENLLKCLRNPEQGFKKSNSMLDSTGDYIIHKEGKKHNIYFSDSGFLMFCSIMKTPASKKIISEVIRTNTNKYF